ncbi:MAG: pknD-B [Chlamydiia bacterium]|nr:pknD-B [Chlamydiia bacterium]
MTDKPVTITCPTCNAVFKRKEESERKHSLVFCAYCGCRLHPTAVMPPKSELQELFASISLRAEQSPKPSEVVTTIGQYQILKSIGKGGMGEVFLAYDTICGRRIALKRIRADLLAHPQLHNRFLREARITSQLIHPTIIPIYAIHQEDHLTYYSMPYVEGETLKQVIKRAREAEKHRERAKDPHTSIPSLVRIFLQVCQACAYAHSQGVLHRDLKPENFIIGKYGQVLILDWGLAKLVSEKEDEGLTEEIIAPSRHLHMLTKIGKVVGTIAYMAPERALGQIATVQTDIYSLGVILYQILTLQLPFQRKSLAHFKKHWKEEQLIAPELLAPYREVPQVLSEIVKKCLSFDPKTRYHSIDELIQSLENYIEGKSEWFPVRTLDCNQKEDWAFQENVLIAEHTAITRATDVSDWVSLMVSKDTFTDNTKIEAEVLIGEKGHGLGILFSHPAHEEGQVTEGYCLWLASTNEKVKKTKLLRSSVCVVEASDIVLPVGELQRIRIEKIDHHIYFYLNDLLQFSYVSHIPVIGNHIGILAKDADFEMKNFTISIGSQNIMIGCLTVPDAFLANKDYDRALTEYRRIGAAFPGRAEGREAFFRAGITLLEKAKTESNPKLAGELYSRAHEEFSELRSTPGAPLEYLGKALIYQTLKDYDEEIKCYELALRRYRRHPLLLILEEQIAFRMHESSRENRKAAYEFISLVLRFLPQLAQSHAAKKLFSSLEKNWDVPSFILHERGKLDEELQTLSFCVQLAFWLTKPHLLKESVDQLLQRPILPITLISDAIFLMAQIGAQNTATETLKKIRSLLSDAEQKRLLADFVLLDLVLNVKGLPIQERLASALKITSKQTERTLNYLLQQAINNEQIIQCQEVIPLLEHRNEKSIDAKLMAAYLYLHDDDSLERIVTKYTPKELEDESSPLYFPYGCALAKLHGEKRAHLLFSQLLEMPYPRAPLLGAHFLVGNLQLEDGWLARSFLWERRCLYEQLTLFYHVIQDQEKKEAFHMLAAKCD